MIEDHIVEVAGNYQSITEVGLIMRLLYICNWFDVDYIKNMFQKLGFDSLTSQKLHMIFQIWRKTRRRIFWMMNDPKLYYIYKCT